MISPRTLPLLLLLLLPIFVPSTTAQLRSIAKSCSEDGNYTAGSTYSRNLNTLLSTLAADNQNTTGFYNLSSGQAPDRVSSIGLCRGDVEPDDCQTCISIAAGRILRDCPTQKEAVQYSDYCMLRFSNRSIYGELDPNPFTNVTNIDNASDPTQFGAALETLLTRLRGQAAAGSSVKKFATGTERRGLVTIYGLEQCTPDLSRRLCDRCLVEAIALNGEYSGGKVGGRILKPNCQLRFEVYRFYAGTDAPPSLPPSRQLPPPPPPEDGGGENSSRVMAVVIPSAAVIGFIIFFFCRRRLKKSRLDNQRSSQQDANFEVEYEISNEGWSQYNFEVIQAATNNFALERKLGEGGFGAVYKGVLSNHEEIAVKRLNRDSRQGDLEFKNEVTLVAKLQHRNLVRLLGFSLERKERLLVYEFIPNASLDHFLFDEDKRVPLNWERRYKIIEGIVRCMVYLHKDSRLKIIHRDLKAGNILLDSKMNLKISDFGMASLFDMDESQGNTKRIVGTYGYMAPEYVMRGQFSVKSDVFSFGVLVLEIVSGQKNKFAQNGSSMEDLLSYAWKNWRNETYTNIIDMSIRNVVSSAQITQITRCIHIGLLCVQENAIKRPTMASVALKLADDSMSLPLPSKPAFFMYTAAGAVGGSSSSCGCSSSTDQDLPLSRNEASISELYPR